jgi:hypothetical protein
MLFEDYNKVWVKTLSVNRIHLNKLTTADLVQMLGQELEEETGRMICHAEDFGGAGDESVTCVLPKDLGIDLDALTLVEDYIRRED